MAKAKKEKFDFKTFFMNIILFILLILLGTKGYITYSYYISDHDFDLYDAVYFALKYDASYNITTENYNESFYYTFSNIKFVNNFDDFKVTYEDENKIEFTDYSSFGNVNSSFTIEIFDNPVYEIKNKETTLEEITYIDLITIENKEEIVTKYLNEINVDNEYELILTFNGELETTFISNLEIIKSNYAVNEIIGEYFSTGTTKLISGDYVGYTTNYTEDGVDLKSFTIIEDNINYKFTFTNTDYFSDLEISELLSSLVIS